MERAKDWLRQAKKDLQHARNSITSLDYEWACFAAQQSAEKAVKALYQALHADPWGHSVSRLLQLLPKDIIVETRLIDSAKILDRHYIPSRYPNAHPSGAPTDYYIKDDAEQAVEFAQSIYTFCEGQVRTLQKADR